MDRSDADLVKQCRMGDAGAYSALLQRYQRAIYGIVSGMIRNRDDVDDIVQEVFVLAYRSLSSFRGDAAFSTWLYRIAVNTSIKQMKKIRNRHAASIDDPDTGLADVLMSPESNRPDKLTEQNARASALREAVRTLPEKHRAVVVLHYFQDLSCDQIAGVLGCSVGTVWSRLHYACRKLQGQLNWLADDDQGLRDGT